MILHPVTRPVRPHDQVATNAWLAGKLNVVTVLCDNASDYPAALLAAWPGTLDLVVVEHDIVPRDDVLTDFARCRLAFCTAPYQLAGGAVSLLDPRTREALPGSPADYSGHVLACLSGLGCVRLRSQYRARVDTSTFAGVYDGLDERVSRDILRAGYRWHVHPPVAAHTGRP